MTKPSVNNHKYMTFTVYADGKETVHKEVSASELSTMVQDDIEAACEAVEFFHDLMNVGIAHYQRLSQMVLVYSK